MISYLFFCIKRLRGNPWAIRDYVTISAFIRKCFNYMDMQAYHYDISIG